MDQRPVMDGTQSREDREEDYRFLHSVLMEKRLHLLFKIHERLKRFEKRNPVPLLKDAQRLASDLVEELVDPGVDAEILTELTNLLSQPDFRGMLSVHDSVALKDYEPRLPALPDPPEENQESVRIISVVKNQEPLGATIRRDGSTGAIIVARIMRGGSADKSGLIHEGDELREINGVPLEDKKPEEILPILAQAEADVKFKVIPGVSEEHEQSDITETTLFVRVLFDYDPMMDPAIPCKEAGLSFRRGDVIQIVSREDDTWWQARRHGDGSTWAGLIPSKQLHERRVALQRPKALFQLQSVQQPTTDDKEEESADYRAITGIHIAGLRRSFRQSRSGCDRRATQAERGGGGLEGPCDAPTYMEVVPFHRGPKDGHRAVLLLGPSGVGVSELKRRLIISDPELYGATVPHTTRLKKQQEQEGEDYHFVTEQLFGEDILKHRFIEYGKHNGYYYGTHLDTVNRVIAEGKVCLLDVLPHTMKQMYTAELKPFVVFVKPPAIEELRFSRRTSKVLSEDQGTRANRAFSEGDFEEMIRSAEATESRYGHLFDRVVVNGDVTTAFKELRAELERLDEAETRWIPKEWSHS